MNSRLIIEIVEFKDMFGKIAGIIVLMLVGMFFLAGGVHGEGTNWLSLFIGAACQGGAATLYQKIRQGKTRAIASGRDASGKGGR